MSYHFSVQYRATWRTVHLVTGDLAKTHVVCESEYSDSTLFYHAPKMSFIRKWRSARKGKKTQAIRGVIYILCCLEDFGCAVRRLRPLFEIVHWQQLYTPNRDV